MDDSNLSDITSKLNYITVVVDDAKIKLQEIEDRLEIHSEAIRTLEQWKSGNGAKGAEDRLQVAENGIHAYQMLRIPERVNLAESDITALQCIADGRIGEAVKISVQSTGIITYFLGFVILIEFVLLFFLFTRARSILFKSPSTSR